MTAMYSPFVYAQASAGGAYTMPPLPSTFVSLAFTPPTWSPYSASAADRTQYWVDTAGTLTEAQALEAVYGLPTMKTQQIALVNAACGATIQGGFPTTVEGQSVTVTLSPTDQTNALMAAVTAQTAHAAAAWAAATAYAVNAIIAASGDFYIAATSGTSAATAPAWPAAFQTPVTDGTVTWARLGFWVGTTTGNVMVSVADVMTLYPIGLAFVSAQRTKYQVLQAEINAATTPDAVLALVWA